METKRDSSLSKPMGIRRGKGKKLPVQDNQKKSNRTLARAKSQKQCGNHCSDHKKEDPYVMQLPTVLSQGQRAAELKECKGLPIR